MKLLTGLRPLSFLVAVTCAATAGVPLQVLAQSYIVTDLGTLNGGPTSAAFALNEAAHVAGSSRLPPNGFPLRPFLWVEGTMTDLGTLGGSTGLAFGINNADQVAGTSTLTSGFGHAVLWEDGVMMDLGTPTNTASEADAINDAGQIAGTIDLTAFIWEDGVMTELGTLPGFAGSFGHGINQAGEVVGGAFLCHFCGGRAVHWVDGAITDLGVLPGWESSGASAINDVGQIVGVSATLSPSLLRATLWDNGKIIDLGAGEGIYSGAFGINNAGVIVGYWGISELFVQHYATKWVDGELIDLNELIPADSGWVLHEAADINESGQIVGTGINPDGDGHGFLLTPCAPADFDCDGDVDAADLAQLLGTWGPCPEPCTPGAAETCPADFDHDCQVTAADLAQLLGSWGDA